MHRFFIEGRLAPQCVYSLSDDDARHAARVLRLGVGDDVVLMDGCALYQGKLTSVSTCEVRAQALFSLPDTEAKTRLTLYQGLPKADKLELITQKVTELGAEAVCPLIMTRCVRRTEGKNADGITVRLRRIAREAAKQSGRTRVPDIEDAITVEALTRLINGYDAVLMPWEDEKQLSLRDALARVSVKSARIALIIGPEGGIDGEEAKRLIEAGVIACTLGPRIFRTETAAIAAVAMTLCEMGDMA